MTFNFNKASKRGVLCLAVLATSAFTALSQSLFFPIIESVVNTNKEILSEEKSISSSLTASQAENSLEGPEVAFEYLWATSSSNRWNIGISQELKWPGSIKTANAATEANADLSRMLLLAMKADKALSAKEAIIDIIYNYQKLDYYLTVQSHLQEIYRLSQKAFKSRNITILDLKKIEISLLDNEQQVSELLSDIERSKARLASLGSTTEYSDSIWQNYPLQLCDRPTAETDRILYQIQAARQNTSQMQLKALKMSAWPSLSVGYRHAYEDGEHFNGISLGLNLPSFSQRRKKEALILEKESEALAIEGRIIDETSENEGIYKSVITLEKTIEKYRNLCGDTSYLTLLQNALEGGEINMIDYITEIDLFSQSHLNYLDMLYRKNLSLARLNRYRSMDF